ncbi:hypothetical protein C4585_02710 [Candidatus Parcubacteria bacterium]|nr:MAG: hypothetical protein C4585_02710 [Candidatus Parcubacteria bacterium]
MFPASNKVRIIVGALAVLFVGVGIFFLFRSEPPKAQEAAIEQPAVVRSVIGSSVEGRSIEAYSYGTGGTTLAFVGGIHGGYEWNSVLLAYELMDYLEEDPERIPADLQIIVIPAANPDGLYKIVGKEGRFALSDVASRDQSSGRFNANGVDLNRNFACKWQPQATWRGNKVSAGTAAFSEPESQALRDFFQKERPVTAVFFHSQADAVYASECEKGVLPETLAIMNAYADAAGYPAVSSFDAYPITGDVEGWLASIGIPAITVELASHEEVEWEKNQRGIEALLKRYGK